ncbi:MAG TPA: hypothetical protein DEP47_05755 [Chloroflexi bacterium]|nr:hypothetical protein [Chloroflexota bacterium]
MPPNNHNSQFHLNHGGIGLQILEGNELAGARSVGFGHFSFGAYDESCLYFCHALSGNPPDQVITL